jgi:hypothetical protein
MGVRPAARAARGGATAMPQRKVPVRCLYWSLCWWFASPLPVAARVWIPRASLAVRRREPASCAPRLHRSCRRGKKPGARQWRAPCDSSPAPNRSGTGVERGFPAARHSPRRTAAPRTSLRRRRSRRPCFDTRPQSTEHNGPLAQRQLCAGHSTTRLDPAAAQEPVASLRRAALVLVLNMPWTPPR